MLTFPRLGAFAAGTALTLTLLATAFTPADAGSSLHKSFCRAGDPTPKYVCDHLKAHDAKKPAPRATGGASTALKSR